MDCWGKTILVSVCVCLTITIRGSEYDQYKLVNGKSISGWLMAMDGKRVLIRHKDGNHQFHLLEELSDGSQSKVRTLRKNKDVVHVSQYVETSNADPDRFLIPTYSQSGFEQYWGCVANAAINYLLWWDKLGVCHIPKEGTEAEKAEWLHDKLYSYVKTYDEAGSDFSRLRQGLIAFFEDYPSDNYFFEYDTVYFHANKNALVENVNGLNMTVLSMSKVSASGNQRISGHAMSVLEASDTHGILLNTWGDTYMAQLFEPSGTVFKNNDTMKRAVWVPDFISSTPDTFDKSGHYIIHGSDSLFIMRPVRRATAPEKLVESDSETIVSKETAELSIKNRRRLRQDELETALRLKRDSTYTLFVNDTIKFNDIQFLENQQTSKFQYIDESPSYIKSPAYHWEIDKYGMLELFTPGRPRKVAFEFYVSINHENKLIMRSRGTPRTVITED